MLNKLLYTIFIGVLLATFVGVGIAAFYTPPQPPKFQGPYTPPTHDLESSQSAQYMKEQQRSIQTQSDYSKRSETYNKNVSTIALAAAIIILVLSLTILKNFQVMADGTMLGGVLTLIYSLGRGFGSGDEKFRFVVVSAGLIIALGLGYIKFVRSSKS